jgi:AraC-like DNA-binding protein
MHRVETMTVPPEARTRYWCDEVGRVTGMPFRIEPRSTRPFEMRSNCATIDSVVVGEVWGSAHRVWQGVLPCDDRDVCVVFVPRTANGRIKYDGAEHALAIDHAYLLDNRTPWSVLEHDHFHHLFVAAPRSGISALDDGDAHAPFIRSNTAVATLVELMKSLVEAHVDIEALRPTSQKALSAALRDLLDEAIESTARAPADDRHHTTGREAHHKRRIRDYALAHLADPHLSVASVASAVGVSTRHLHRLYAGEAMPLGQWIWAERLDRCHAELISTSGSRPISAIGQAWGFRDHAHFSRAFRTRFGMTPSVARRTATN